MKMKTIFLASLVSVSFLSGQNKKLLFIGIDGCRPDALSQAQTPNMDALINNGLFINDALCSMINMGGLIIPLAGPTMMSILPLTY